MKFLREKWTFGFLAGLATLTVAFAVDITLTHWTLPRQENEGAKGGVSPQYQQDTLVTGEKGDWPIYLTTMTHLEGGWTMAVTDEAFFDLQVTKLRYGMDIAEEYDGLLTIESEMPMAEGMIRFETNILAEALERGHGVGTHCDIAPKVSYGDDALIYQFLERKKFVDSLVGSEENLGCSGGGGLSNWYAGATGAGFSYLNGLVGYHYLALPEKDRPSGWDDRAIFNAFYHYPAPQDERKYFYPFLVSQLGFTEDPQGDLLLTDGSLGNVSVMAESEPWGLDVDTSCPSDSCAFTDEDGEAVARFIETFIEDFDGLRPAKITIYLPTNLFLPRYEDALRTLFSELQEFAQEGSVVWATQREVYDGVMNYYDSLAEAEE